MLPGTFRGKAKKERSTFRSPKGIKVHGNTGRAAAMGNVDDRSYIAGKGKEPLCKDELFVAISASIKLPRCVRALRFDRAPTVKRNRASEKRSHEKRIKHIGASLEKSKLAAVI